MSRKLWIIPLLLIFAIQIPAAGQKKNKKKKAYNELFGKKHARYKIISDELSDASFYIVSGHGGPDPGAMGKYHGKVVTEDEYAYDIALRLGRELLRRGAKVEFIIQDAKDGIRDTKVLKNSKRETCMGKTIPLNQLERLKQRSEAVNKLYKKDNKKYRRAIFIHVDSRSRGKQIDVFFYHAPKSRYGMRLAQNIRDVFDAKYKHHQPGRGFDGTVEPRELYVLMHTIPVGVFLEVGNIQNPRDQKRLVLENNRQAMANWITQGILKDHKKK